MQMLLGIKKRKWDRSIPLPWLRPGSIPADPVTDFRTKDNSISVWCVLDESQVEQLVAALAANRDRVDVFEYALFDEHLLKRVNVKVKEVPGCLPCGTVNPWHRDIVQLTGSKIFALAKAIYPVLQTRRVYGAEVRQLIKREIQSGAIDPSKLRESMIKSIGL